MIKLQSLYDLKKQPPTQDIVHVKTVNKLYRYIDGEWIERVYYTTEDVANILGLKTDRVRRILAKLGMKKQLLAASNVNYDQLILLTKILKMKKENPQLRYKDIKLKMKL